jgi:hypothetical protein
MLKKWATDFLCWIGYYPPTLVNARKTAIETNKVYKTAIKKVKTAPKKDIWPKDFKAEDVAKALDKQAPKPKEKKVATKPGLYANIHAKQKRIVAGSGEKMRKAGSKGAPTAKEFKEAAKTAKEKND